MVILYRIVSPGETTPFLSASPNRDACLVASRAGCTISGVTVGSPGAGVAGSFVGTTGSWSLLTVPWLATCLTPAGSVVATRTSKVIVALPPAPGMVPRLTITGGVPVFPPTIVPWLVVTELITSVVFASGVSLKITPVALLLPLLIILIV